jgi:hypothetical protein
MIWYYLSRIFKILFHYTVEIRAKPCVWCSMCQYREHGYVWQMFCGNIDQVDGKKYQCYICIKTWREEWIVESRLLFIYWLNFSISMFLDFVMNDYCENEWYRSNLLLNISSTSLIIRANTTKIICTCTGSINSNIFSLRYIGIRDNTITIAMVSSRHKPRRPPSNGFMFHSASDNVLFNQYNSFYIKLKNSISHFNVKKSERSLSERQSSLNMLYFLKKKIWSYLH